MKAVRGLLLVGLVLTNLAFVQITRAASWTWLFPLVLLSLAAPVLVPFRRQLLYRVAWNGAVLGVFGLLVHHATSRGIHLLLEDGLLLAALCQVHLLNNIGPDQKPDLLFFNSFLIAVVTSLLSLDLAYSIVFLVYAPLLILTMQVNDLVRREAPATRRLLLRVFSDGVGKAAVALAITLLCFFFVPRDFHRRGLLGDRFRFAPAGSFLDIGFNEEVTLGLSGKARASDRVVMRIVLEEGRREDVPTHWRGATLDHFDGTRWRFHRGTPAGWTGRWLRAGRGVWTRAAPGGGPRLRVRIDDPTLTRLFMPLESRRLALEGDPDVRIEPRTDLTFIYPRSSGRSGPVGYRLELSPRDAVPERLDHPPVGLTPFLRLEPGTIPAAARRIARSVAGRLRGKADTRLVAEALRRHLSTRFTYLPPGAEGAATSLTAFFEGQGGGHCEYFASALAMLLRLEGIPCRLVTGYRSDEWDAAGRVLTVRARHAHAWVEVLDGETGWYPADPSPVVDPAADGPESAGILSRIAGLAGRFWAEVTSFDSDARARAGRWISTAAGRLAATVEGNTAPSALALLLLAGAVLGLRRLRRPAMPPPVREYRRAVRRTGLAAARGETPRELLLRARRAAIHPKRLRRLERATEAHEAARYAAEGARP